MLNTVFCRQCHKEIDPTDQFCKACGAEQHVSVKHDPTPKPTEPTPVSASPKTTCPKCGGKLADGVCAWCAMQVSTPVEPERRSFVPVVIVVVVVAVCIAGFALTHQNSPDPTTQKTGDASHVRSAGFGTAATANQLPTTFAGNSGAQQIVGYSVQQQLSTPTRLPQQQPQAPSRLIAPNQSAPSQTLPTDAAAMQQPTSAPPATSQPSPSESADAQFKIDVSQAVLQHSLAEAKLTKARQAGGNADRYEAAISLAKSLDYDMAAVNRRISAGALTDEQHNLLEAELTRLQGEQGRQRVTANRDIAEYDWGVSEARLSIAEYQAGNMALGDASSAKSKQQFRNVDANNDQAVSAVRSAESRLQVLAGKGGNYQ